MTTTATQPSFAEWRGDEPLAAPQRLLEASAGTGKTYNIAHVVTRLVAEAPGVPIDRMLVMTFTRAAAAELRDRIRRRLVAAREAMRALLAGGAEPADDPLLAHVVRGGVAADDSTTARLRRVLRALEAFDQATITTIHSFSQRMLGELAFEAGQETGLEVLPEAEALLADLAHDVAAEVWAAVTSEEEAFAIDKVGVSPESLKKLAQQVARAVPPRLDPLAAVGGGRQGQHWQPSRFEALREALRGAVAGTSSGELGKKEALKSKQSADAFCSWVGAGASFFGMFNKGKPLTFVMNLRGAASESLSPSAAAAIEAGRALVDAYDHAWGETLSTAATEVQRRLHDALTQRRLVTFDAMLRYLADGLGADPASSPLAAAIRGRFDVALIDEFQDTDACQWKVLEATFAAPGTSQRLLLVGDPKQAIYGFRGADIFVYRRAVEGVVDAGKATMRKNFRSHPSLLAAMNRLWLAEGQPRALFGAEVGFDFVEVTSGRPDRAADAAIGGVVPSAAGGERPRRPLELRWLAPAPGQDGEADDARRDDGHQGATAEFATIDAARSDAARRCADEVRALLHASSSIFDATTKQARGIRPGDIAVLVRTHNQAAFVATALRRANVPYAYSGRDKVQTSSAAKTLLAWLRAVAAPRDRGALGAVALTPLCGFSLLEVAQIHADDDGDATADLAAATGPAVAPAGAPTAQRRWRVLQAHFEELAQRWQTLGLLPCFERTASRYGAFARIVAQEQGERHATDLRHLVELLHAEERQSRATPSALADRLSAAGEDGDEAGDNLLRLETDAAAVKIVTWHASKGLEYPIVLLPMAWDEGELRSNDGISYHDAAAGADGAPTLCLYPSGTAAYSEAKVAAEAERAEEMMRLLYVAMTRAAQHLVVWFGGATDKVKLPRRMGSALATLLLAESARKSAELVEERRGITGEAAPAKARRADIDAALAEVLAAAVERFLALGQHPSATIGAELLPLAPLASGDEPQPSAEAPPTLTDPWPGDRASFDDGWQSLSFSGVARGRAMLLAVKHSAEARDHDPGSDDGDDADTAGLAGEDDAAGLADEDPDEASDDVDFDSTDALPPPPAVRSAPSSADPAWLAEPPLAVLYGGKEFGTWVHAVFEHLDFGDPALAAGAPADPAAWEPLLTKVRGLAARHGIRAKITRRDGGVAKEIDQVETLASALPGIVHTRWATRHEHLPAEFCLADAKASDRFNELVFDLGVGGPSARLDRTRAHAALRRMSEVLPGWIGQPWLDHVLEHDAAIVHEVWGLLTGSIDLLLRVRGRDGSHRFYVCDYKTNRLRLPDRSSPRYLYDHAGMAVEMGNHAYHLQALFYTVATHRLLRSRLGDRYDYDKHVGGHAYLFVRAMEGPNTLRDANGAALGVYLDRWPRAVVEAMDAALAMPAPHAGPEVPR